MEKETSMASKFKKRLASFVSFIPSAERIAKAMKRATSRIPFMDDVLALYYCAIDPKTPAKIRIVIGATLLYLVMPLDIIPDFLAIIGYTDDITALMIVIKLVSSHVTQVHKDRARDRLGLLRSEAEGTTEVGGA
jgi:uncharacterized membrane protein YkvA (DUF1232 family)